MAGIITRDEIVAALSAGVTYPVIKATIATQGTGGWSSLWRATGTPAQGAIPGAAAICDVALTGCLGALATPGGGQRNAVLRASMTSGSAGPLVILVDRLSHMGGLNGTTTPGNQTVNVDLTTLAGTRCASDYSDVVWWAEIYTDIGTTAVTMTVNYTDSGNTGRTTTLSFGGASPLNQDSRIFPIIPAAATPLPIKSVQSISLSASTLTAGSFGITATREIAPFALPLVANYADLYDWARLGAPTVAGDACLAFIQLCTTTSTGALQGSVTIGTA
jgi:hypothetical protein